MSSRAGPPARSSSRSTDNRERRLLPRDGAEDRAARAPAAAPIRRNRDRPAATSVRPALTVGLRGDVLRRSKRPDVAPPLRRTARATWSRYRSSAASGSAHPARPRMPFPGHGPLRPRRMPPTFVLLPARVLGTFSGRRRDRTPGAAWVRVAAVSITGVSVVDPDPDRTAVDLSALILDLQACPWLRGRCEGGRRRWSRL